MKIAIVSAGISVKSGLRVPVELAIALRKRGHQIIYFTPAKDKDPKTVVYLRKQNINVQIVKNTNFVKDIVALRKKILQSNPDIISAHCYLSQLIAARLTGIPLIWTYYGTQLNVVREHFFPNQDNWIMIADGLINIIIKRKVWLMALMADRIIAISQATSIELQKIYGKTAAMTIPFGSAPLSFLNNLKHTTPPLKSSSQQSNILLSVSRITPYKGFHRLIEIVNNISLDFPNIKLVIAGSAPLPRYLKYLKRIAEKNVQFKVNVSDHQLIGLYKSAYLYLSADEYLFYGLPVWEASHFGIPTIALNRQAAPEAAIHGKTGYLAENPYQLEKYIRFLIKRPDLRKRLGKNASLLAAKHTWHSTAEDYEKLFNKYLSKK
jgi:glycosyltransferase involved in cell wall biosynthesis